jgi:hypothetical protein
MIFADVRLRGVMDGIDLAREVKMRWPRLLPVILTSGHPGERVGDQKNVAGKLTSMATISTVGTSGSLIC